MKTTRFSLLLSAMIVAVAAVHAQAANAPNEEELIAVLTSADSPKADKAITCKKLAVFGSEDAVPALAPLLHDKELISWARIALEAIPGPEADKVLREAMTELEGRSLVGVINSIAFRRDAAAVPALAERLKDKDAQVASAAAVALGKIGNEPATKTLRQSLNVADESVRSAVAEGCVYAAEQRLADGKSDDAAALYDAVRQADVPKQRVVEATRGAIVARGTGGIPLLVEQLRSDDEELFQIGLMTARQLPGKETAEAVGAEMGEATPERAALLLHVLADRGDAAASPAVVAAAESGPKLTRIAAIRVLASAGSASSVPKLFEIAAEEDQEVALAAQKALAEMPGKDVDARILERLSEAEGESLRALIELVGERQIDATDALRKAIDHPNAEIRTAALAALGETIKQDDLDLLIERVISPKRPEDTAAAEKALRTACVRMPDGEACAAELAAAMDDAPTDAQVALIEILGQLDNPRSLAALSAAAKSGKTELQDAATRVLGQTLSLDAGPILLDLAQTLPDGKFKIRAIRGYIRLVRQFNMPQEKRVDMCDKALKAAERPEEQKMVLEVIERYPSLPMLRLAAKAAENPALRSKAIDAMVKIARELDGNSAEVKKLLESVGVKPQKVEIIKAEYGAGDQWKDVTKTLQSAAGNMPTISLPSPQYNSAFGGDPVPRVVQDAEGRIPN